MTADNLANAKTNERRQRTTAGLMIRFHDHFDARRRYPSCRRERTDIERQVMFFERIVVDKESGCWLWTGPVSKERGYGIVQTGQSSILAHIYAWRFRNPGKRYPRGLISQCGNQSCCNPEHRGTNRPDGHYFKRPIRSLFDPETAKEFWAMVNRVGENECWHWTGRTIKGYGIFAIDGKNQRANRIAFQLHHNCALGEGMRACHSCDNPPCCNPNHLFEGTDTDNARDCAVKGRNSHGEDHHACKLTEDDVRRMRFLRKQFGISDYTLSRDFGVTERAAKLAVNAVTWKHVTGEPMQTNTVTVVTLTENEEKDGYELQFPGPPGKDITTLLKSRGWRFAAHKWVRPVWYVKRDPKQKQFAEILVRNLNAPDEDSAVVEAPPKTTEAITPRLAPVVPGKVLTGVTLWE